MKVILQENVEGLGYLGDVLTVAKGYARNYLLPRKKAVVAEERQVKLLQHIKRQTDQKAKKELEALGDVGKNLSKISLTFEVQTGKDDKLFGSVTSKDVAEKLAAQGVEVDRKKIHLPQPLRELGTFSVAVKLHRDVVPKISVTLVKKGGEEAAPEEATSQEESATDETASE
ncbi:MAG: 50S ribosomal protein L9 [Nitrospirota bacterium]|nr:50S ribosomal protein L9 [Nitrospirota bacterium]MDH5296148.1 50S ribosomal protein L9 [Nitrospirota bacterium]MDH5574085.1 50S ribosomal protein L9 [Nitrospirota bacterium]